MVLASLHRETVSWARQANVYRICSYQFSVLQQRSLGPSGEGARDHSTSSLGRVSVKWSVAIRSLSESKIPHPVKLMAVGYCKSCMEDAVHCAWAQ